MGQKKRKPSWKWYGDESDEAAAGSFNVFADNDLVAELFAYMDSPEGELRLKIDDTLEELLIDVQLDPRKRLLLWPDATQLNVDQSVERIHKLYPNYPPDIIEEALLDWLVTGYTPPADFSVRQIDDLDRRTERWVTDHECRALNPKNKTRTSHS